LPKKKTLSPLALHPVANGITYEIVFSASSIQQCYTPQPQLFFNSYSSVKASVKSTTVTTVEEFEFDDWNTDDEFEDSDVAI
jgi:hypothetical protein